MIADQSPPEATERDRRGRRRLPTGNPWLLLVGLGLLAVLAAVAWVQYRQVALLSSQVRYEGDNLVWSFVQLESEAMQLRDLLREARRHPEGDYRDALRLRYELFASRLPLVEPLRTRGIVEIGGDHHRTVARLRALFARFDPVFAESQSGAPPPDQVAALLGALDALMEPVHDMSLQANQVVAEQIGQRNDTVRDQSRLSVGLTAFQSLLTLAFALITARQFGSLQRRRREQERLARQYQQARLEAEGANHAKSLFLANMSHELRTPLNGMLGMLSLLESSPLNRRQADQLRTARESAIHLLALLNDILDISKLESGRIDIVTEPLSLRRLVGEVEAMMAASAAAKGLRLAVMLDDTLPARVLADDQRLRQILLNLMSNAVKFCDRGQVSLEVRADTAATSVPGRVALALVVRDSGIGIDDATLALLFHRFTQGDASTSRRYGGSGLGLEISRNLARLMGGDIAVQSAPGEGAEFTLRLSLELAGEPAAATTETTEATAWDVVAAASEPADADPPLEADPAEPVEPVERPQALELLVVDDHPTNRKYMAGLLGQMGHRVRLASDGAQAVAEVRKRPPDLVFMDLHMPVQDGEQATRALRALPMPVCSVPIVALTADAFPETRVRVIAAGMDSFLSKPVQSQEIERLLHDFFGERGGPRQAGSPEVGDGDGDGDGDDDGGGRGAGRGGGDLVVAAAPAAQVAPPSAQAASATAQAAPRRRFRSSDVVNHLDMAVIGDVCVGVTTSGYRTVLADFFADRSGGRARLLDRLDAAQTAELAALAHGLKGAAVSLGLRAIGLSAAALEAGGAALDAPGCADAAARLREQLETTEALLRRMGFL